VPRVNPKRVIVFAGFFFSFLCAYLGFKFPTGFWQTLMVNLATTFLALALAVIVVNLYLEHRKKREAVRALLLVSNDAIAEFHNTFLQFLWTSYSKSDFKKIRDDYINANGDPDAVSPDNRAKIYELAKNNSKQFTTLVENLDQSLSELTSLVGWGLDVDLLAHILKSRFTIRKFRKVQFDDTPETKKHVCEALLDIDSFTQFARNKLKEIGDVDIQ
jgi:hypothetical protein